MPFPLPPWEIGAGAVLLGLVGWFVWVRFLHPTWRKERRVTRAFEKAFDEGDDYKLVRLRIEPGDPSIGDLFPSPFGSSGTPRYFTYNIETAGGDEGEDPDFSGMDGEEISLVRHYLRRSPKNVLHYGREVIRPE